MAATSGDGRAVTSSRVNTGENELLETAFTIIFTGMLSAGHTMVSVAVWAVPVEEPVKVIVETSAKNMEIGIMAGRLVGYKMNRLL